MRFPVTFSRWKGGSQPANVPTLLGADAVPADGNAPNQKTMDNLLTSRFISIMGWPIYRVGVIYKPPSGTYALTADLWLYEDSLGMWFRANATAGVTLTPRVATYFDVAAPIDLTHVNADLGAVNPGSMSALLVVADPGAAPAGLHQFAMCSDLTSLGTN